MALSNCVVDGISVYPTCRKPFNMVFEWAKTWDLVGLGRVELPTSPLSGVRSSHLSYRPLLLLATIQALPNFVFCNEVLPV
jgi:hypothetical protein